MSYALMTAVAVAFLTTVCLEGAVVTWWRFNQARRPDAPRMAEGPEAALRLRLRRRIVFWVGLLILCEGGHDAVRTAFYVLRLDHWPQAWSFAFTFAECVAVLGLIRTFTRSACGEWGWVLAIVLPLAAALGVLFQ